jgi:type I restriction enzyme S subunit
MPDEWKQARLGELLGPKGYIRGPFGSALRRNELLSEGVPVYEQQHAIEHSREFRFFISAVKHSKMNRFTVQPHDVIVSCSGTIGRVSVIRQDDPIGIISQALLILRPDTKKLDPYYLHYFLTSREGINSISSRSSGSVQVNIAKREIIESIELSAPSVEVQREIVGVLRALDDKIEQNRRTGRKLEELARAVFKAWFVDFEPVKAKASGASAFPGMPAETFAALPTRFVDSELGPVPEGWEVCKLGDVCEINARTIKKGQSFGHIEYIDIASVSVGQLTGIQRVSLDEAPGRARRIIQHGDTIWSCVRPNRKSYLFIHSPPNNRIASTGFAVLSPSILGACFIYEITTRQGFVEYLVANADGSAYPAVRSDHFAAADVLVPVKTFRDAFEETVMPLRDLIASNDAESDSLAALRDYLLPRLLSGRVRVGSGAAKSE